MELVNHTPYSLERVIIFDRSGAETLLVTAKATYDFAPGVTRIADEQDPVIMADEYRGDPNESSLIHATEILPPRQMTDVMVTGHAIAPQQGVRQMQVGVQIGNLSQQAIVFGDRPGFSDLGNPRPFEKIPLIWENAFGGIDHTPEDEKNYGHQPGNPVGKGFFTRGSSKNPSETPLPNIENPAQLVRSPGDNPAPVGFGPVAPCWLPRMSYAGTYDDDWLKTRAPLLPDDFDDRYFQVAPNSLMASSYLLGNEQCVIQGMTHEGVVQFPLQAMPPFFRVRLAKSGIRSKPVLETVHINADARKVSLTWKSAINIHGRVEELRQIEARLD